MLTYTLCFIKILFIKYVSNKRKCKHCKYTKEIHWDWSSSIVHITDFNHKIQFTNTWVPKECFIDYLSETQCIFWYKQY